MTAENIRVAVIPPPAPSSLDVVLENVSNIILKNKFYYLYLASQFSVMYYLSVLHHCEDKQTFGLANPA